MARTRFSEYAVMTSKPDEEYARDPKCQALAALLLLEILLRWQATPLFSRHARRVLPQGAVPHRNSHPRLLIHCMLLSRKICHVHGALHPIAKDVAAIPTSSTSNNDSLSGQIDPVATSSFSSSRGDHPLSSSLQRDETNIVPHLVSDTP